MPFLYYIIIIGYKVITARQLYSLMEKVSKYGMCCSHTLSFLQSEQSRTCSYVWALQIVRFAESDFSGVAKGRIGGCFPHFPKDQFWDSTKSDKKSVRLLEGYH